MPDRVHNVLFLCTHNSARSIMAEALLNHLGEGRFHAFSAGSEGGPGPKPMALKVLEAEGIPTAGLSSKTWDVFAAYAETVPARRHYRHTNNGRQAGDPAKAVAVMLQAVDAEHPPLHLPIGPRAHAIAEQKLAAFRADITAWRDISIATDFDIQRGRTESIGGSEVQDMRS